MELPITIFLGREQVPSIFVFTLLLHFNALHFNALQGSHVHVNVLLQKPCQVDLAVLKKIINFWRFQNCSTNLLGIYYKRGKVVSYFLNNAAKTCLYGLKKLENIEIGYFFQSRTFFHLSSNLHTCWLTVFRGRLLRMDSTWQYRSQGFVCKYSVSEYST